MTRSAAPPTTGAISPGSSSIRPAAPAPAARPPGTSSRGDGPTDSSPRSARSAGASGPTWRVGPNGEGGAGPPPGHPSGTVLDFGRHIGWSLGEIVKVDPGYLEWLDKQPEGVRLRDEIDRTLRAKGLRIDGPSKPTGRGNRRFGLSGR